MTVYGFGDKENAETLNRFAATLRGNTAAGNQSRGEEAMIVQVPAGETLDARVGADVGTLLCEIQQLGTGATLSDSGNTCLVYNKSETAFQAGEYLDVVRQKSLWIALSGGGGGGSAIYQLQSTTLITAASGLTVGSGSADILELQTGGSAYIALVGTPVDVRNPWAESIEIGSMITAHKNTVDGVDYFIVIQASCPTETP